MIKALRSRLHQGYRTNAFPAEDPRLPERYSGAPRLDASRCSGCGACTKVCPVEAISLEPEGQGGSAGIRLDMGRCIFCRACEAACREKVITFAGSFRMGARTRSALVLDSSNPAAGEARLIEALDAEMRRVFGRAMKIRQVSAAGCNACEADINVLETIGFDLSRFGISIAASPRHADAIMVTGPVSRNMELALRKTYDAMPSPKLVIAVGACAISGGLFRGLPEVCGGADAVIPVDLYIPGCPPHPMTILNGLLELLGRIEKRP